MEKLGYAAVLAALVLIYVPRGVVARQMAKLPEGYDNRHPRAQQTKLSGLGLRAQGAHMNSMEAFAPFAAAVLIATTAGVAPGTVAGLAWSFVAFRVLYIALYLADKSTARSAVWGLAMICTVGLLVMALV